MISRAQAKNELFGKLFDVWPETALIVGYVPALYFQGLPEPEKPDQTKFWARISMQHIDAPQTTLSNGVGELGKSRYTASGLLFVQLFGPKATDQAEFKLGALADFVRMVYVKRSPLAYVVTRNSRVNDGIPDEQQMKRQNVIAEFEYDELI